MIISKRKKFILFFITLLSVFSLFFVFPASAAISDYFVASSIKYAGQSPNFDDIQFSLIDSPPGVFGYYISNPGGRLDGLGVFDFVFTVNPEYQGSSGVLSFVAVAQGFTASNPNSYRTFFNINFDRPFTEGEGYSFRGLANTPQQSIKISVPVENLGSQFYVRFNHYANYELCGLYLTDVSFEFEYSQPDPGISSDISDIEDGESSIVSDTEGDYKGQVFYGENKVLDFFNSASDSLLFVKTMFNKLVTDKIYILVIASIMLAILPVLINVAGGFRK